MKRILSVAHWLLWLAMTSAAQEQIKATPSSVTVHTQGATSVFLTYGNVKDRQAVDACWCGELIAADPDIGFKCNPEKIFGCLPVRYNQSRLSGTDAYTDIMTVPPSVARRAYMDAASGAEATFFYVRRFTSATGGPDEFVPVTIRMSGNGAAVPFSLTSVKLSWEVDKPVMFVKAGERLPSIKAEITYTGTGQLKGRWELVKPGEEMPSERDLLTESSLPVEERGLKRRYTELSRFNLYLPPVGRFVLPGPEARRMSSSLEGMYLVLLRIEAVDDARGNADLASVGAGPSTVKSGAVAGFPLPVMRYYVGGSAGGQPASQPKATLARVSPADNALVPATAVELRWAEIEGAALYRIEIEDAQGKPLMSAALKSDVVTYRAPSWLKERAESLRWRVIALDQAGAQIGDTEWHSLRLSAAR